jgi:hypothetical protein
LALREALAPELLAQVGKLRPELGYLLFEGVDAVEQGVG